MYATHIFWRFVDIHIHREAVDAVVSVFSARQAEAEAAKSNASKSLEAAQQKTKELATLSITISLDVAAPKMVVPVSSTRDDGFVLVDMGHMLVEGGSVKGGGMAYRAELSDMNVRFPAKKALLLKGTGDAVVEPFKIKVDATMGGGDSKPGMALAVEVMPGVKGIMSPAKIRDLFQVLDYVTKADLKAEGGPGERPLGLAAPNTAIGGGGVGVKRMGDQGVIALEYDDEAQATEGEEGVLQNEPLVLLELNMKMPTIAMLLLGADEDATDKDSGLLMEAAGVCACAVCTRQQRDPTGFRAVPSYAHRNVLQLFHSVPCLAKHERTHTSIPPSQSGSLKACRWVSRPPGRT